jgi:glycosyltransferase involved in cell wall biosynthesis
LEGIPILNLVQGLRHLDPGNIRYQYLLEKAIRICVSRAVFEKLKKDKSVNNPIFHISNGIDRSDFPRILPYCKKNIDLLIIGSKRNKYSSLVKLIIHLKKCLSLSNRKIVLVRDYMPRKDFLSTVNHAKVTLFIPYKEEGFYLPALEGMALGTLVVCPDCGGNRDYCKDKKNSYVPKYNIRDIINTVVDALDNSKSNTKKIIENAKKTAIEQSLNKERKEFLTILGNIELLWQ